MIPLLSLKKAISYFEQQVPDLSSSDIFCETQSGRNSINQRDYYKSNYINLTA